MGNSGGNTVPEYYGAKREREGGLAIGLIKLLSQLRGVIICGRN
jgi:hypothetical protein